VKNRYDASGHPEMQYQLGSGKKVLRNNLGIKSQMEMDRVEALALERATSIVLHTYSRTHRFTAQDIRWMHKVWLGDVYERAGIYRNINLSKQGFMFAVAEYVPKLMEGFEKDLLKAETPCLFREKNRVAESLARVHVELVMIHPFREGNGRISRLLGLLTAAQAGYRFEVKALSGARTTEYFAAVRSGAAGNYRPLGELFGGVLSK
jgi:cell filamentation protein